MPGYNYHVNYYNHTLDRAKPTTYHARLSHADAAARDHVLGYPTNHCSLFATDQSVALSYTRDRDALNRPTPAVHIEPW